ncbi:MAG: leucine-rich repeat domain-containing protein [Oscillatoriaceae cyanobacterium Prado104]|jgi:internalin A|nr:leucine-rich repeat domain-containing protein [Oscillatoriaceae cyanobacterium Prado104]
MSEQERSKSSINFRSFTDWCLYKNSLCAAARHTVEVLLDKAGTSDINEADRILSSKGKMSLQFCHILDITPLQSLTNLTSLNLTGNQISDITPLQFLTNLTHLLLHDNQISDITPLQFLTNLTHLLLHDNQISEIAPLQSLTSLKFLILHGNQISDIAPLQSLTSLTSVNLGSNKISDITPLQFLNNLMGLYLQSNRISDITPLQSLTSLIYVNLGGNKISDITPLQFLTNLTSLNLTGNKISDITPLQSLTCLTSLNLDGNQISNIAPLKSLINLSWLELSNNQISEIVSLQFLTNLTNLTYLNLNYNQISNITSLQALTNLNHLELVKNQISDILPLRYLTNLHSLRLDFDRAATTPQQKALLETCRHSYSSLANSTEQIDRAKASTALQSACEILGLKTPEIIFIPSPKAVLSQLQISKKQPEIKFVLELEKQAIDALLPFSLITELQGYFLSEIAWTQQLENLWEEELYELSIVTPKYLVKAIAMAEFCVSGLGISLKPESQKLFAAIEQLLAECGWIFMFEDVFYVCSRPTKLSLDSQYRLHAEGESAIEFADGYKIYSYHGVTLPEKYGHIHPEMWQAQWLLEEENAELRRVLIQGIGYARICQELQATELDCWQEYALLRIDADIDGFNPEDFEDDDGVPEKEPIHLLKMTCPSTGFIHALRVPPDIASAREAIRWVNWDIEPEEFSVQT